MYYNAITLTDFVAADARFFSWQLVVRDRSSIGLFCQSTCVVHSQWFSILYAIWEYWYTMYRVFCDYYRKLNEARNGRGWSRKGTLINVWLILIYFPILAGVALGHEPVRRSIVHRPMCFGSKIRYWSI